MTVTDFLIGEDVRIIDVPRRYDTLAPDLLNAIGTVVDTYIGDITTIGVQIPGLNNSRSRTGVFWFEQEHLRLYEEKTQMNIDNFDNKYTFATLVRVDKPDATVDIGASLVPLKEGDLVVCDYRYAGGALSVRRVVTPNVSRGILGTVDCEIMGVADISAYVEHTTMEERKAELKKQMIERAKKYQEEAFWKMIAASDPEMADLYKEFEELSK